MLLRVTQKGNVAPSRKSDAHDLRAFYTQQWLQTFAYALLISREKKYMWRRMKISGRTHIAACSFGTNVRTASALQKNHSPNSYFVESSVQG